MSSTPPRPRVPLPRVPAPGQGGDRPVPGREVTPPGDGKGPGWRVAPGPDGRGAPKPRMRSVLRRYLVFILALFALNYLLSAIFFPPAERPRVPYSPVFLEQVEAGNVKSIASRGDTVTGDFKKQITVGTGNDAVKTEIFATEVPAFADDNALDELLRAKGVVVNAEPPDEGRGILPSLLIGFGPTLLLIAVFVYIARRQMNAAGAGGLGAFGRSRARRADQAEVTRTTFEDVAGIDEAEDELVEIVDFLKNPTRYQQLGARIPRGVLLSGPPGTGKTLLARAVAGEAGVPFFTMSASEFIEAIVGIGASRVRDLFVQAKAAAPAIIFIDELDAIGRSRSGGAGAFRGGGNDEREQTLNQILTEMDGFDSTTSVIVLAATNRPEILDAALLRPGRFDRRIVVQPPDTRGRRLILDVHTRSLPLADDVDLDAIASSTVGMVGAELANLCNEAALLAARREHASVHMADFTDALEKVVLGAERNIVLSQADRERTAYHEAGHAIVGMLTPGADPVRKVSVVPRGMALGVTLSSPDTDRVSHDRDYLLGRIRVALGGRAAEEVVYSTITTGAESDLEQVAAIARRMVGRWGMSDAIGPVAVLPSETSMFGGDVSEATHQLVDEEVRRLVEDQHERTVALLTEHRDKLESLTRALLEAETLDQAAAYAAAGLSAAPAQA